MRVWLCLCVVATLLVSRAATADEAAPPAPAKPPVPTSVRLSHHKQFLLSIRLVEGLRAIAPYDGEYCGDTDITRPNQFAAVCTGRTPFSLDLELGYGIAQKIDVFLELRLGLESDFGSSQSDVEGTRQFHISPGARFFFGDAGSSKLFTTAQVVFDMSGYQNLAGAGLGTDFGVRNMNGIWFDLDRAYGFYVFVGETATFSRWLRFELEAGVGVQGRYR
ncbi:MAG: hypothetical protein H0V17_25925 [Deltaproteobacteria bacterium]|nr:hypothetical protein [Deltaproteobacteria bacterium]